MEYAPRGIPCGRDMRYRLVIVTSNNGRIRLRFWRATYQVLVSVVIPAFQSSCHIAQALESVFAQTFTDYEVLVVNDGSPDTDLLEQARSEEHTSELQSLTNLVCRLLLEKKKKKV